MTRKTCCRYCLVLHRNVLCLLLTLFIILICLCSMNTDYISSFTPKSAYKYKSFEVKQMEPTKTSAEIQDLVNKHNLKENILNSETFGPIKADSVILVVHVHKYRSHLKYLLVSLSQVRGIQDALVIFSHSYFDENVNRLISMIDFCKVLQIFYPYSIQIYPNEFPGFHENDCPYDMKTKTAQAIGCTGASTPDIHGQYRHPAHAESKHHWWWTANKVFENLTCTEDHDGIIFFLEDDVYLMEDFLFMAQFMKSTADRLQQCDFVSLGATGLENLKDNNTHFAEVTTWDPVYHSSVFGFDISVWNNIVTHYDLFCMVDDFSWSRSLFYISMNRRIGTRFKVISSMVPRAPKTSDCVFYVQFINSDPKQCVYQVLKLQERIKDILYPPHLEIYTNIELETDYFETFEYVDNNGGWSDERDQNFCRNVTINKIKKVIFEMNIQFKNEYED